MFPCAARVVPTINAVGGADVGVARDARVDFVKGIAIIGVVLHHVSNRRFSTGFLSTLERLVNIFAWAVFAFMFVSGYLYGRCSLRRKEPVWRQVADRGRRLLIPYLWLGVTYAVLFQLVQRFGLIDFDASRYPATLGGKLFSMLAALHPVGDQLYFFVLLFVCSTLVMSLRALARTEQQFSAGVLFICAVGVACVLALYPKNMPTTGLTIPMVILGTAQFAAGAAYGRTNASRGWKWMVPAVVLAAVVACVVCSSWRPVHLVVPLTLFVACGMLPPAVLAWKPVALLGVASGTIFAFHIPFLLHPMLVIFHKLGVREGVNVVTAVCMTLAACVVIHGVLWGYQWCRWLRV
jgi:fucose 4-O-acetylase-like acetyltransferase